MRSLVFTFYVFLGLIGCVQINRLGGEGEVMVLVNTLEVKVKNTERLIDMIFQELMSRPKGGEGAYNLRISVW